MMCTTSGSFLVDIWELHTKRAVKSCGKHYVENNILINKPIYIYHGLPWFIHPGCSLQAIQSDFHGLFFNIPSGRDSSVAFVRGV